MLNQTFVVSTISRLALVSTNMTPIKFPTKLNIINVPTVLWR